MVRRPHVPSLALLLLTACGGDERPVAAAEQAPPAAAAPAAPARTLAIRPLGDAPGLEAALREGGFFRWVASRLPDLRVEVGPEATGDAVLLVDLLPPELATRELLAGLPLELGASSVRVGGSEYGAREHALAVRVPGREPATWLVAGATLEAVVPLADELLARLAGRRGGPPDFDYRVRETPYLGRSGSFRREGDAWTLDPARERDLLAERDRAVAALAQTEAGPVTLLAPRGEDHGRLVATLGAAVRDMAARLPLAVERPVTVAVEPDHVAQGRHTGDIGEAVVTAGRGAADVHLVVHPDDLHAYRFALARVLLARSGAARELPPWLAAGAALWLSGDWYGRPFRDWLPLFAAAGALPDAEELLAAEPQDDASAILWTPVAAAVVDRLPGATLAEKLRARPDRSRVAAALADLQQLPRPAPAAKPALPQSFLAGVSFAMLNSLEGGYHAPAADRQLAALAAMGVDAVSIMPFAYQEGPRSSQLAYLNGSPSSETDVGLLHAARRARARGLAVLWKPHVWVGWNSWPGEVEMTGEEDWRRWFRSYRRYVLHHAVLARWAGSDLFCIGVELDRTTARREWREIIAGVRALFPGPITYASNWHGGLEQVPFWGLLDYVGADAYYPLAASPTASEAELARGAREVAARLEAAARRHRKPLLLTEVGFAARRGAWMSPHEEGGDYSEGDQARAYAALFAALGQGRRREPWLAGMFLWKAFSDARSDAGQRADFRFVGRQAEALVREYYGAAR